MKKIISIGSVAAAALLAACSSVGHRPDSSAAEVAELKRQVALVAAQRKVEKANLDNFDDLDFNVYSGQRWDQLSRSHHKDIVVHYPDGKVTKGIAAHIEELKPMFVFAPDSRIREHPIRIASGEWTAVTGTVEGTFSRPMPIGDGKTIAPTGRKFKLEMVTIGHWTKDGVMDEEWLMWDNLSFMKQIGLAQ